MEITPLCEIAFKYKTDKCPQIFHTYTPVYYAMFNDKRESFKKVLELGIGTKNTMRHVDNYTIGASLCTWRDFFPNAQIYGIDIDPEVIFQEERITTFLVDMRSREELIKMIERVGSDIDLVIDDGPHNIKSQVNTARTLMPLLNKGVTYIVEDVSKCDILKENLPEYDVEIIQLEKVSRDNNLVVIKHK
jgi:hypothetical protein